LFLFDQAKRKERGRKPDQKSIIKEAPDKPLHASFINQKQP